MRCGEDYKEAVHGTLKIHILVDGASICEIVDFETRGQLEKMNGFCVTESKR